MQVNRTDLGRVALLLGLGVAPASAALAGCFSSEATSPKAAGSSGAGTPSANGPSDALANSIPASDSGLPSNAGSAGAPASTADAGAALADAAAPENASDSGARAARTRPRIFMAMTGSNQLADDPSNDSQWTYVQANLDGLWGNQYNFTPQEQAALWQKLANKNLFGESDAVLKPDWVGPGVFSQGDEYMPGVTINRDTLCLFSSNYDDWNSTRIADLTAFYVNNNQPYPNGPFQHVCAGFEPFNPGDLGPGAQAAFTTAPYVFIEYPATAWTINGGGDNFTEPAKAVKANGQNFVWFDSIYTVGAVTTGDAWLASTQKAYADFKAMGFLTADDVIILVNYNNQIASVPEQVGGVAAPTATGVAYWLLHQN